MRRRSKILLTVSACVIFFGIILCLIGAAVGNAGNEQIFPEETSEGRRYTYFFGDSEIGRVTVDAVNANINIYGKAECSKIEIINFNENLYTFTNSNTMVTFKESENVSGALRFWESGFTFKGLRYLLRAGGNGKNGIINIYLAEDVKVKAFDFSVQAGSINISKIYSDSDFTLNLGGGNITMQNIETASGINITTGTSGKVPISLRNIISENILVNSQTAALKAENIKASLCDIYIKTGSAALNYSPIRDNEKFTVDVNAKGKLTVDNSTDYIDTFSYSPEISEEEEYASLKINGDDLSVTLLTPIEKDNSEG